MRMRRWHLHFSSGAINFRKGASMNDLRTERKAGSRFLRTVVNINAVFAFLGCCTLCLACRLEKLRVTCAILLRPAPRAFPARLPNHFRDIRYANRLVEISHFKADFTFVHEVEIFERHMWPGAVKAGDTTPSRSLHSHVLAGRRRRCWPNGESEVAAFRACLRRRRARGQHFDLVIFS